MITKAAGVTLVIALLSSGATLPGASAADLP